MWLAMMSLMAGLVPGSIPSAHGARSSDAPAMDQLAEIVAPASTASERRSAQGKVALDSRSKANQAPDRLVPAPGPRRPPPTTQMRAAYEQCVGQAARQEPDRISRDALEALVNTRCRNQKAALRTAILQREGASPDAERLAAEELRAATESGISSARRTPR